MADGFAVHASNVRAREALSDGPVLWHSNEIWDGDVIIGLNGKKTRKEIMDELRSSTSLHFEIERPLNRLVPRLVEVKLAREPEESSWGVELLTPDENRPFQVGAISPGSVLERWNEANPSFRAEQGDRVLAVNGEMTANRIIAVLQDVSIREATWLLVRGIVATPLPPKITSGPFQKQQGEKLGIIIGNALESPICGATIEEMSLKAVVVKEVKPGCIVAGWNSSRPMHQVHLGAILISVNGNADSRRFGSELSKPIVTIVTQPPRGTFTEGGQAVGSNLAMQTDSFHSMETPTC